MSSTLMNIIIASVSILTIGISGILVNLIAILVIFLNPLLHNTFGHLCFSHLISNIGILICFTTWPIAMIFNQDNDVAHSATAKKFGQAVLIFWYSCTIAHIAISINRFITIVFPIKSQVWLTKTFTNFCIFFIWLTSFLATIPYFWDDDCYLAFNAHTFKWTYADGQCGQFLSKFDFIFGSCSFSFVFLLDMCTLLRLRLVNNVMTTNQTTLSEMKKRRKNEIRLFTQAMTQCCVFCLTLISFHIFTLFSDQLWYLFSMVTICWIAAHFFDGLIVLFFHFRVSLFKKSPMVIGSTTLGTATRMAKNVFQVIPNKSIRV